MEPRRRNENEDANPPAPAGYYHEETAFYWVSAACLFAWATAGETLLPGAAMTNKGNLLLKLHLGERLFIGDTEVFVSSVWNHSGQEIDGAVTLAIAADRDVNIVREKVLQRRKA